MSLTAKNEQPCIVHCSDKADHIQRVSLSNSQIDEPIADQNGRCKSGDDCCHQY